MSRGLALFAARLFTNKYKDTVIAHLGATVILNKLNLVGKLAKPLNYLIRCFLGLFQESGVFLIDITLDAYKEGKNLEEFKVMATEAYNKATAKVYDETEKEKIRQEYLEIISKFGVVGNPK